MSEQKPITLNSLVFCDDKAVEIVREDYFLEFQNEDYADKFIESRYQYWTTLLDMKLMYSLDMNETLTEIEIKRVLRLVSKFLKLRYRDVISKSQKTEFVEARRYAAIICIERKKNRSSIYEHMNMDHSTLSHHEKQFRNYCDSDPDYKRTYGECYEFVMSQLKQENHERTI